jgi:hypothetical protein
MSASDGGRTAHPLEGAWKKLRWAKVNLDTLQRETSDFFGDPSDPDSLRGYLDIKMPDKLSQSRLEPPWHWPLLIGDIVQSFRASLDYLAWELARLNLRHLGRTREPARPTAFPITTGPDFWSFDSPKLADIGRDERQLIHDLQPYNEKLPTEPPALKPPLESLRELSNQDKHQQLALVFGKAAFVEQSLPHGAPGWAFVSSSKTETMKIISPEGKVKSEFEMKTAFFIQLEEADRIDWILDGIGPKVAQVLSAFEPFFEDA